MITNRNWLAKERIARDIVTKRPGRVKITKHHSIEILLSIKRQDVKYLMQIKQDEQTDIRNHQQIGLIAEIFERKS